MEARCSRWDGGPAMPRGKVLGSDAAGRSPGVRPVFEPVVALRSGEGVGEKSIRGRGAVWAGEAIVVFWGEEVAEVVVEGMMLLEARRGARGEKARRGAVRKVKGRWSAICVVTQGAGAELLELCELL